MRATAHGVVVAQPNMSSFSGFATTGDSDASPDSTASQFILLRGLEPGVTEEMLAKGVCKLYKSKADGSSDVQTKKVKIASTSNDTSLGAKAGSLRRVLLVRDRKSNDSWRYGFAEFNNVEDAQLAMAKYNASDKFTISSKPVLVTYIHAGVFVPVLQAIDSEMARFTFSPLSNPTMKLMYWDEAAYASELVTAVPDSEFIAASKESKHARLAAAAANEGLVAGVDVEPKPKKRKIEKDALPNSKKVVAPHLQFWTNRHAELHGTTAKTNGDETATLASSNQRVADTDSTLPSQSFADMDRKCCLLCSRQFKTDAEVNKHERISQLHRDNMKDENLIAKANAKLKKIATSQTDSLSYRDRARERRQAFNQPKQPAAQHPKLKDPTTEVTKDIESDSSTPAQSKGAALLGKMGWLEGQGLGAQGTGRTEAITTELYTQGVGLGASGGKIGDALEEAQRQTKGSYAEFLNKTKDKAKERFESMG
ncbi:RNA-binding protein [Phlyctema vagabunda]|uniref:RNA-binding protein n=1 Tax=Phlyctema vagabunda TaxID=108571 RepID=A0ABR4PA91_9HELO